MPPAWLAIAPPSISVLIATYNRADDLRQCLQSLAALAYPHWEVVVVDQSDNEAAHAVVDAIAGRLPSVRYLHSPDKGLARARNLGIAESTGEIIAFLDDDCTVGVDWLERVAAAFADHPRAALVFGCLRAAVSGDALFTPAFEVTREHMRHGPAALLTPGGFGGSMYVRRGAAQRIGPFDPFFGAGARFASNDDREFTSRALMRGLVVVETPQIVVLHYGARSVESGAIGAMFRAMALSQAAMHLKVLRCGYLPVLLPMAVEIWKSIRVISLRNILLRRGPTRLVWLAYYGRGVAASLRLSVDRRRCLYRERTERLL